MLLIKVAVGLISFGCRYGSSGRLSGSHRHGTDDPVIVVARYPNLGRISARPNVSMYCKAQSGEPEPSLCSSTCCIPIVRHCEIETDRSNNVAGEGTREPDGPSPRRLFIGGLGGNDCPLVEGSFAKNS